jgi:hypothetical protein
VSARAPKWATDPPLTCIVQAIAVRVCHACSARLLQCPLIDYSPRTLWPLQRGEHVMEARLMPHAQYVAASSWWMNQVRAAQAFEQQTAALL